MKNGVWTFECAIPWKNFGFTPAAGKDFRINFCRDFAENNEWTCLAPGDYFAVPAYAKVTLLPDAPHLDLAQFGALYDGTIQSRITLWGRQDDTVKAGLSVKPAFSLLILKRHSPWQTAADRRRRLPARFRTTVT